MHKHSHTNADGSIERHIDKLFEQFNNSPGCVIGVSRHGKEFFAMAYGMANLETGIPLSTMSVFYVASLSKQFTAMCVLLLAEEGKVSLGDSIRITIPELPAYANDITLRHLLNHTSGIRDYNDLGALAGYPDDYAYTYQDMMDIVCRQKELNFQPGSEFQYGNSGYVLLSIMLTRSTGMTLNAYAQERIFEPLGMTSTYFQNDQTPQSPNCVHGYKFHGGEWRISDCPHNMAGAGGLYTTVGDMLKWAANLDTPVVGEQALRQMRTKSTLDNGQEIDYGLGLLVDTRYGLARIGHAGDLAGFQANFDYFPLERLAVVIFCNNAAADLTKLAVQAAEQYMGIVGAKTDRPKSPDSHRCNMFHDS